MHAAAVPEADLANLADPVEVAARVVSWLERSTELPSPWKHRIELRESGSQR